MVIPPADARVVAPPTFSCPPTYKSSSIPTPPWVIIDPVSLLIDCVESFTKIASSIWVVPAWEFKIRFPTFVLIVLVSILILSNVPTPVTFKLLILTWEVKVPIPDTFRFWVPILVTSISPPFISTVVKVDTPVAFNLFRVVDW